MPDRNARWDRFPERLQRVSVDNPTVHAAMMAHVNGMLDYEAALEAMAMTLAEQNANLLQQNMTLARNAPSA